MPDASHTFFDNLWPKSGNVKLTKLTAQKSHEGMLPTSYYLKGTLLSTIEVGSPLQILRYERAAQTPDETTPVHTIGIFTSSPITAIDRLSGRVADVTTENSVWRVEFLSERPPEELTQGEGNIS